MTDVLTADELDAEPGYPGVTARHRLCDCGGCGVPLLGRRFAREWVPGLPGLVAGRVVAGARAVPYCKTCLRAKIEAYRRGR